MNQERFKMSKNSLKNVRKNSNAAKNRAEHISEIFVIYQFSEILDLAQVNFQTFFHSEQNDQE